MTADADVCASCGEDQSGEAYGEIRRIVIDEYGDAAADDYDVALGMLGDAVDRGDVLAVIPAVFMSTDGLLAVTGEELLFASNDADDDEPESELLVAIARVAVDPKDGTMIVTLDDRSSMAIGCTTSPLAAAAFGGVLEQAIRAAPIASEDESWGENTLLETVRYVGDHPLYPHRLDRAEVMITEGGAGVYASEGGDDDAVLWLDREDITMVTFGGNPIEPPSLLVIDTRVGRATFEVTSVGAHELAAELEPFFDRVAIPAADAIPTIEERLARLKSLSEAGLITDDDYATRRTEILREV